jgi:hypothetical protein
MGDFSPASALQRFIEPFVHFFATPEIWQAPLTKLDWRSVPRIAAHSRRLRLYGKHAKPAELYSPTASERRYHGL